MSWQGQLSKIEYAQGLGSNNVSMLIFWFWYFCVILIFTVFVLYNNYIVKYMMMAFTT